MKEGQRVTCKHRDLGVGIVDRVIEGTPFTFETLLVQFQNEKVKGFADEFEPYQEKKQLIDLDDFNQAWIDICEKDGRLTKALDNMADGDDQLALIGILTSTITIQELKAELFKGVLEDGD